MCNRRTNQGVRDCAPEALPAGSPGLRGGRGRSRCLGTHCGLCGLACYGDADRLSNIARFGVGYDNVDVAACTEQSVMLTITPDGVRRPVAAAVLTLLLALSHKLLVKDHLTREGRWAEKIGYMGQGVTGRTLGVVGLGNIGRDVFRLAQPFGMHHLAYDPFVS